MINEIGLLYTIGVLLTILGHSHPNDWSSFPYQPIEFIIPFICHFSFAYQDTYSQSRAVLKEMAI